MRYNIVFGLYFLFIFTLSRAGEPPEIVSISDTPSVRTSRMPETTPVVNEYTYKIVNVFPHDSQAYTQGLVYHNGFLYESTGQYGRSSIRKSDRHKSPRYTQKKVTGTKNADSGRARFRRNLLLHNRPLCG